MSEPKIPLIIIVGPTAVGKTELALKVAEALKGEIISADSRLFYRGMDIGTAKPTVEERKRVSHYLIDVADPDDTWSLALFKKEAQAAIQQIHQAGRLPFLVGGTGQFVRAVTEDWSIPEQAPDLPLRAALSRWAEEIGGDGLHTRLAVLDPVAAQNIDPRNVRRVVRALEVCLMTGRRFSEQRKKTDSPYRLLIIGLKRERSELFERIDCRVEEMIRQGFIAEVEGLLAKGYSSELPSFSAIGYREITWYLQGKLTLEEAKTLIKRGTHQYVRRQANWFKETDPEIRWFDACSDTEQKVIEWIQESLP